MGGPGSGQWLGSTRKQTVEECVGLEAWLMMDVVWGHNIPVGDAILWTTSQTDAYVRAVDVTVESKSDSETRVMLSFALEMNGQPEWIDQPVRLVMSGDGQGRRWRFECPGDGNGPCLRRVEVLYLPAGQSRFMCRHCHDLAYDSQLT
jgi:hypothetical protein